VPSVPRRADIVFAGVRLAVFVDGCFFHGCHQHGSWPTTNADWWRRKIATTRRRDLDTNRRLGQAGWMVVRLWEHQDLGHAAVKIVALVRDLADRRRTHGRAKGGSYE
jgi:DNA mismatch endonuclease (patch repair protein)